MRAIFCLSLLLPFLSSCLSVSVVKAIKNTQSINERVDLAESAFLLDSSTLVLNFKGNCKGKEKQKNYHLRIPVDSVLRIKPSLDISPGSELSRKSKGIEHVYYYENQLGVYLKRSCLHKGFYFAKGKNVKKISLEGSYGPFYSGGNWYTQYSDSLKSSYDSLNLAKKERMRLGLHDEKMELPVYYRVVEADWQLKGYPDLYFKLEEKRKFPRIYMAPLLAFTLPVDIVTLPIQLWLMSKMFYAPVR